jgi:hypothetical protein
LPPEKKNTRLPTPLHTRVTPLHYYNYYYYLMDIDETNEEDERNGEKERTTNKASAEFFFFTCCSLNHNQADIKRTARNLYTSKPYYIYIY